MIFKKISSGIFILFASLATQAQISPADSLFALARAEFSEHKFESAETHIQAAIQENPQSELNLFAGNLYLSQNQYQKAIEAYTKAESLEKHSADYELARAYALSKQTNEAINALQNHLAGKNPQLLFRLNSDTAFRELRDTKAWIQLSKEKHYNSYEEKMSEAEYAFSVGNYTQAFAEVSEIISKQKNKDEAYMLRGDIHFIENNIKQAQKNYAQAVKIRPKNTDYLLKKAQTNLALGKYETAIEDFNKILEMKPFQTEIYFDLSEAYFQSKEYRKAEKAISHYTNFYTENTESLYQKAKIQLAAKNIPDALIGANQYAAEIKSEKSFVLLGDIHSEIGMFDEAFSDYSMSLDMSPRNGEIWYKAGLALAQSGKLDEACEYFDKAVEFRYYKASDAKAEYCR